MKKLLLLIPCVFLLVFTSFSEGKNNSRPLSEKTVEIKQKLKIIEGKYIAALSYHERRQAIRTMDDVMVLVGSLEKNDNTPHQHQAMPNQKFTKLIKELKNVGTSRDQKYVLFKRSVNAYYTVNQLIQILNILKFDDDKLEVVVTLYPKVVDKNKLFKVLNSLSFHRSKSELSKLLEKFDKHGYSESE